MEVTKNMMLRLVVAFLLGALTLFTIRFMIIDKQEVHYHANFAVFVEGYRLPFDNFIYYEEVASCGGNGEESPKIRAHMHDQVNHVVHVHDNGATWGHFFANLGMTLGDRIFSYDKVIYIDDEQTSVEFLLNGESVETIANRTIGDEDVLLISVGDPSEEDLRAQYDQIEKDADFYNQNDDPSACSGGKPFTLTERLKAATGLFNE